MSLASKIVDELVKQGLTFQIEGKKATPREVIEVVKDIVCTKVLSEDQGGLLEKPYLCNKCAKTVVSG